jgi:hypothetical protein
VDCIVIIGTFSIDGPKKCSGLVVKQYEEKSMIELFEQHCFKNISCKSVDHITLREQLKTLFFAALQISQLSK